MPLCRSVGEQGRGRLFLLAPGSASEQGLDTAAVAPAQTPSSLLRLLTAPSCPAGTPVPQLDDAWKDVYSRAALLFFVVAFLTFMSIAAFPAFIEGENEGQGRAGQGARCVP